MNPTSITDLLFDDIELLGDAVQEEENFSVSNNETDCTGDCC